MSSFKSSKHISRIAAIQVMYQKDISDLDLEKTIDNFINYYINTEEEYKDINIKFFKKLTSNFTKELDFADIIGRNLDKGRSFSSMALISNSIIKVAIIEMIFENTDIPVIINEYVEISKSFLDIKGVKFTNAILDKISRQVERQCQKNI